MWADDVIWYPYFIKGKIFHAEFFTENKYEKIISHKIEIHYDMMFLIYILLYTMIMNSWLIDQYK